MHVRGEKTEEAYFMAIRTMRADEEVEYFEIVKTSLGEGAFPLPYVERQRLAEQLKTIRCQMQQGCVQKAIAELQVLVAESQVPAVYLLLAEAQMRNNEMPAAFDTLAVLEQQHPDLAEKDLLQGIFLFELGRNDEARLILHQAIQRKPGLVLAWRILMHLAVEEDNLTEAVRIFQDALKHAAGQPIFLSLQSCLHQNCREVWQSR